MKFLPQKRWKKILLITFLVIVVTLVSFLAYVSYAISNDVETQTVTKNLLGTKTALILYHPGISSFAHDVTYSYADGLVFSGYKVEIATPSSKAPIDASKYDLIVFCASVYAGEPDAPIIRHLARMGDLQGTKIAIIIAGAGTSDAAKITMQNHIIAANGDIVQTTSVFSMAPNEGDKTATEIATQAGKAFLP
jgi:hypothetical protein